MKTLTLLFLFVAATCFGQPLLHNRYTTNVDATAISFQPFFTQFNTSQFTNDGLSFVAIEPGALTTNQALYLPTTISNNVVLWHNQTSTPFASITAARNAAVPGDLVEVVSGIFTENNLLTNGVNYYFHPGTKVLWKATTTNTPSDYWGIWDDRPCGPTTNVIGGFGDFVWQGYTNLFASTQVNSYAANCLGAYTVTNPTSVVTLTCNTIQKSSWLEPSSTYNVCCALFNGYSTINCNHIFDPYANIPLVFTNINNPHSPTKVSGVTPIVWMLGTNHVTAKTIEASGSAVAGPGVIYGAWGIGVTTNDVCEFYLNADMMNGKLYVDSGSFGFRDWINIPVMENTTSNTSANATCISLFGSGKHYINAMKMANSPSGTGAAVVDSGSVGSLGTSNTLVWITAQKITGNNSWFNITSGTNVAIVGELDDASGSCVNTVAAAGHLLLTVAKYPGNQSFWNQSVIVNGSLVVTNAPINALTNIANYNTSSNPTNSFVINTIYTNAAQRSLLVGSYFTAPVASATNIITMRYTNNGVGYTLQMGAVQSAGLGGATIPFGGVPLSPNATFQFTTNGAGFAYVTNVVNWLQ